MGDTCGLCDGNYKLLLIEITSRDFDQGITIIIDMKIIKITQACNHVGVTCWSRGQKYKLILAKIMSRDSEQLTIVFRIKIG